MDFRELTQPIAEAITLTYDAPVDEILTAYLDSEGTVFGQLMSGGNFYSYAADNNTITTDYHPEETEYLNEYAHAVLDSIGIHTDTWNTYDYALGFFRVDAQVKCKPGNKPCGKRCIPQQMKCRSSMGGTAQGKMRQGRANLRSPGAGAIAAGVVGAAAAAAAGGVAYKNREAIKNKANEIGNEAWVAGKQAEKAVKNKAEEIRNKAESIGNEAWVARKQAEEAIKGKASELRKNVEEGVNKAKEHIQEAASKTGRAAKRAGKKAVVAVERTKREVDKHVSNAQKGVQEMSNRVQREARRAGKKAVIAVERAKRLKAKKA